MLRSGEQARPADQAGRRLQKLAKQVAETAQRWGRECFAEQYIEGREFNLALLTTSTRSGEEGREDAGDVEVLPPAEIDFSAFPAPETARGGLSGQVG